MLLLTEPSRVMSHYTTLNKYGKRTRNFRDVFIFIESSFLYFRAFLIKTIIPLALVGNEMNIANSVLRALGIIVKCLVVFYTKITCH